MLDISAVKNFCSQKSKPKSTKFRKHVSIGHTPNHAKFYRTWSNGVSEVLQFFALHYFGTPVGPLGQSSPVWVEIYSMAPSIKVPNFVPFWQALYETFCRCRRLQKRTVNGLLGWLEFNVPFQHKYGYIRDEQTANDKASVYHAVTKKTNLNLNQQLTARIANMCVAVVPMLQITSTK